MESFVLKWPEEENWKITHSSVEGDGRTIALEFEPQKPLYEGESALQLIWIARQMPQLNDFFEKWLADFTQSQPGLLLKSLPYTLPRPSRLFILENLTLKGENKSAIGFMAAGENNILLHLNLLPAESFPPDAISHRLELFETLEVKEQGLKDSLRESALVPDAGNSRSQEQEVQRSQSEIVPEDIREFAHPLHPEDFPYWEINIDKGRMELFWARILKEVRTELFVAMDWSDENATSFYLKWDRRRNHFFRISPGGLSLLEELNITPCTGCKFSSMDPSTLQKKEVFPQSITCPFCQGEIELNKKDRVDP